jgi:hypothetical protein
MQKRSSVYGIRVCIPLLPILPHVFFPGRLGQSAVQPMHSKMERIA